MNITQIEENLSNLIKNFSKENFIYDLLLAYGLPKSTITLLKKGNSNLSKKEGQIILKKKLFFEEVKDQDLYLAIEAIKKDEKTYRHNPRFIIITNYTNILAIDTKNKDSLDEKIINLNKRFDFFLPLAGLEKANYHNENPADVKAAERMAKIYDEIQKNNNFTEPKDLHSLNIFLSRLLFCFFAEDTGIFKLDAFTNSIASHTQNDGSDLDQYLSRLFEALNTKDRKNYPDYLLVFPYVNGGLFNDNYFVPKFSAKSRKMIIDCGELDWSAINPDIFGSMIQAVVHRDKRSSMGMHYTSVPNIMKVIEPLFLSELKAEFNKNFDDYKKLNQLLARMENLKIFDPACGSGNFLIIAFKELKKLEIEILNRIKEITTAFAFPFSRIKLSQFYGIELDNFACEVARLSLWLAEHQMNVNFMEVFGAGNPTLPLKETGKIICGNATRLNWQEICPQDEGKEIYILGNPPYLGARVQSEQQKLDMDFVFDKKLAKYRDLDYISCWFFKASEFIQNSSFKFAFVSTNSICQGDSVGLLWPHLFKLEVEIFFAYTSFRWQNNAKANAGVTVVIIGLKPINLKSQKLLFIENGKKEFSEKKVENISPYLTEGLNNAVMRTNKAISPNFPKMHFGNMPNDGGGLILVKTEKDELLKQNPEAEIFVKKFLGSQEFIRGQERWCLWIEDKDLNFALSISFIAKRIEITKNHRLKSKDKGTNNLSKRPHQFRDKNTAIKYSIIIPSVSSERREYIPIGFLDEKSIISNLALAIYDAEPWIFAILTSKMHMAWVRSVGGRLGTGFRYSVEICYNTFPFPEISDHQKNMLTTYVYNIIGEREKFCERTMAELYDPDKMPAGLKQAHHDLDIAIELCYRSRPFLSDEERLEHLFKLYEEMTKNEKIGGFK
jgi:type II restriction/modification system DNA methylase subunit YeeA